MTADEVLTKYANEINELNVAYARRAAGRKNFNAVVDSDDWTESAEQNATAEMREADNDYNAQELHLQIEVERELGKGKSSGDFWTAVRKMR